MGGSQSQPLSGSTEPRQENGCAEKDCFNAQDLLRHLQEQEGYEICDVFANGRARVPTLLQHWQEGTESWQAACSSTSTGKQFQSPAADDDTSNAADGNNDQPAGDPEDCGSQMDNDHWVLLSAPKAKPAKAPAPKKGAGKGPGKGPSGKASPPPPPPKAHGPGAKSKAKAKAKCGGPPPPPVACGSGDGSSSGTAGGAAADQCQKSGQQATLPMRRQPGKAVPPPPFGKRLHWKLLPAACLGDTIFEELSPWGEVAPPLDTKQLERLFTPATSSSTTSTSGGTQTGAAPSGSSAGTSQPGKGSGTQGRVCLLTPQRAQNLAIVLRQVTIPTAELCEVLRLMRFSHPSVSQEALEHIFHNLLPQLLESSDAFKAYEGPPEALRDVERQLLPLMKLPRLKARLQSLLFGTSLPRLHSALTARVKHLKEACKQVRDSASLRRLLGTVLRVGNFLNHGVDAPDAGGGVEVRGFAMESLLRLRDFRASQGCESTVSALHCIVLHLQPSEPQLPGKLREELKAVLEEAGSCCSGGASAPTSSGSSVSISDLKEAVNNFRNEAELVHTEAERFGDSYRLDATGGGAVSFPAPLESLKRLAEDARELAEKLEADLAESLSIALRLLEYFGERRQQPSGGVAAGSKSIYVTSEKDDTAIERFFVTLREFASSLEACWREVLEQPSKLRLKNASAAAAAAANGGGSGLLATAASQAITGSDDSSLAGAGKTKPAEQGLARAGLLLGGPPRPGLGLLAGDAVAAVRRRSRAAVPVQPTANRPVQAAALSAASGTADTDASSGGGNGAGGGGFGRWSGGRGYRSSISAAATEVD